MRGRPVHGAAGDGRPAPLDRALVDFRGLGRDGARHLRGELLGDLRALHLRCVSVSEGLLRIRIGVRREADVPLWSIAAIEEGALPGAERLAVLGAPVLTLRLREPACVRSLFGKARRASALALQIDDPAAFRRLLAL